jgi:hypothetical protein
MPVTLQVVNHEAKAWPRESVPDAEKLLGQSCPKHYRRSNRLIQTSFTERDFREGHISPSDNGLVWAAHDAYSQHHHLVIRPEDVWFAILTQLSFYINGHAEELRSFFVAHEGQEHLHLDVEELDFAHTANEMTHLIAKNVIDPGLRDWVMPSFSTTTDSDTVVGAILFMGAMQKYFTFGVGVTCGIPSVTLLGEVEDWKDILRRIDKMELLGAEASLFAKMLRPIAKHMILSFESPESFEVIEFWNTIIHRVSMLSGTDYLTGWLTAFCFWNEQGEAKGLTSEMFGGVMYHTVDVDKVPAGTASVPITVEDGRKYEATMVAGSVGIVATSSGARLGDETTPGTDPNPSSASGEPRGSQSVVRDTIQPLSGWWVCENEPAGNAEAREAEKAQLDKELKEVPMADYETWSKLYRELQALVAY